MDRDTYYDWLRLPRDATPDEIRHAYRELARQLHPDKNLRPGETELFIDVQKAYDVLIDAQQKKAYDATLSAEPVSSQPLTVAVIYSRESLTVDPQPQLIYSLVELIPPADQDSLSSLPLNICLVLDCSTSMQGIRLDTVKVAAHDIIDQLRPEDVFSVVRFNDKAEIVIPAAKHYRQESSYAQIQFLRASGGTEIYQGLQLGYSEVRRYYSRDSINHIILITDGKTYGDEEKCLELVDLAANDGIGISTIGIGGEWNDAFLDLIATRSGGSSKYISDPAELQRFLLENISKLGKSLGEQVRYSFQTPPGIELIGAFRLLPDNSALEATSPMILGNLPRNAKLSFVLEFRANEVPAGIKLISLCNGLLSYSLPGSSGRHDIHQRLRLERPVTDTSDVSPPPAEIIQAISSLTLFRMQEQARQDLHSGNPEAAIRRLNALARHMIAQGQNELARTILSEVVHIQKTRSFSEEGEKRIKYGTRALLLPNTPELKK